MKSKTCKILFILESLINYSVVRSAIVSVASSNVPTSTRTKMLWKIMNKSLVNYMNLFGGLDVWFVHFWYEARGEHLEL